MSDDGRGPMDVQVVERMKKELGLDDPVHVRFTSYLAQARSAAISAHRSARASRWAR